MTRRRWEGDCGSESDIKMEKVLKNTYLSVPYITTLKKIVFQKL